MRLKWCQYECSNPQVWIWKNVSWYALSEQADEIKAVSPADCCRLIHFESKASSVCALLPDRKTHFSSLNFLLMNCVPLEKRQAQPNLLQGKKNHTSHVSYFCSSGLLFKQMVWGEGNSVLCLLKEGVGLLRLPTEKYALEIVKNVFCSGWG